MVPDKRDLKKNECCEFNYRSPKNVFGEEIYINMTSCAAPEDRINEAKRRVVRLGDAFGVNYYFSFGNFKEQEVGVQFSVMETGMLKGDFEIDKETYTPSFEKLNTKGGASFVPLFRKIVQLYDL